MAFEITEPAKYLKVKTPLDFRAKRAKVEALESQAENYKVESIAKRKAMEEDEQKRIIFKTAVENNPRKQGETDDAYQDRLFGAISTAALTGNNFKFHQEINNLQMESKKERALQQKAQAEAVALEQKETDGYVYGAIQNGSTWKALENTMGILEVQGKEKLHGALGKLMEQHSHIKDLPEEQQVAQIRPFLTGLIVNPDLKKRVMVSTGGTQENVNPAAPPLTLQSTQTATSIENNKVKKEIADAKLKAYKERTQKSGSAKYTYKTDPKGNVSVISGDKLVRVIPGIGKQSSDYQKKVISTKEMHRQLDSLIPELERITQDGGLIDQSTGSGIGTLIDMAAGLVGHATDGSIAIGRLQPIWDAALKLVPRFEGPQSDKDTKSYKEASADLANSMTPKKRRKEAGKELLRLMKERRGQFVTQDMIESGAGEELIEVDW